MSRSSSGIPRLLAGIALMIGLAWLWVQATGYTPASDFGYWMGVTGGCTMLVVFLYPLRKRTTGLRAMGSIKPWFYAHMACGVLGPIVIIAHSGFHIGSVNAGVALVSMLLVAASGVIGRFIYVRIHHGLSGAHWTLNELQTAVGASTEEVHSKLAFAPHVEQLLQQFRQSVREAPGGALNRTLAFVTLGLRARAVGRQCRDELAIALKARAAGANWDRAKHRRALRKTMTLVEDYLDAVKRTSQFAVYERLFSLWHVLHVPFVWMLLLTVAAHVVAVHAY
jgi:hypothetical protein